MIPTPKVMIEMFENRVGFTLPPALAEVLEGTERAYISIPKLLKEPLAIDPLDEDSFFGSPDECMLGYDFHFGSIDTGTIRYESCLINDVFGNGDYLFLVGRDGKFLPTLYFANHETAEVQEVIPDISTAIARAAK